MRWVCRAIPGWIAACSVTLFASLASGQTTEPLTLGQAIGDGISQHPMVASAAAALERSKAFVAQAKVNELPTMVAAEEVTLSNDPVFAFGTKLRQARFGSADFELNGLNHASPIGNFGSSVTASWKAFDSGATRRRVRGAELSVHASELAWRHTKEEAAKIITELFYRALLAQEQVTVVSANLKHAEEIQADIRDRVRAGLSLEADGMRADVSVLQARDDLAAAQDNVRVARRDLFEAIGIPASDRPLAAPPVESPAPGPGSEQGMLSSRLDLQALDTQEKAVQLTVSSARRSRGPELSTFGHLESNNPHFASGGSGNWTVGAKLEIRLFDGGARRAQEQEAQAQLHALSAQKELTQRQARSTIEKLRASIVDLQRRYHTAAEAISASHEALRTACDRYAAGLVPVSEVLSTEADLADAQLTRIRVFYQIQIAASDLRFAKGETSFSKAGAQ